MYDAAVVARLGVERRQEAQAPEVLAAGILLDGAEGGIDAAIRELARNRSAEDDGIMLLAGEAHALASALNGAVGWQPSVEVRDARCAPPRSLRSRRRHSRAPPNAGAPVPQRYGAKSIGRGAVLDTLWVPLADQRWKIAALQDARTQESAEEKIRAAVQALRRADPGPHGWCARASASRAAPTAKSGPLATDRTVSRRYIDVGKQGDAARAVVGLLGDGDDTDDPSRYSRPLLGFHEPFDVKSAPLVPAPWLDWAEALFDADLRIRVPAFSPECESPTLTVAYALEDGVGEVVLRLDVLPPGGSDAIPLHPWTTKGAAPVTVAVPLAAQAACREDGCALWWRRQDSRDARGSGRGLQVAELLMRCSADEEW